MFTVCIYELNEPCRESPPVYPSRKRPKVAHHSGNLSLDDSSLLPAPSTDGRNFRSGLCWRLRALYRRHKCPLICIKCVRATRETWTLDNENLERERKKKRSKDAKNRKMRRRISILISILSFPSPPPPHNFILTCSLIN